VTSPASMISGLPSVNTDYRVFSIPKPFLPVSHQSWETDPLVFIHENIVLSHKGALGSERPDHCTALECLSHVGTH
jgi:hypothetical protein